MGNKDADDAASRGDVLLEEGRYDLALKEYDKAIDLDERNALYYLRRAACYAVLNEFQRALDDCQRGIEIDPDELELYAYRAFIFLRVQRPDLAITECQSALQKEPDYVPALSRSADAQFLLGQVDEAIAGYTRALELQPANFVVLNNRATAYMRIDQYQSALNDLERAIRFNPSDAAAYGNRGYARASMGQHLDAIDDYSQALSMNKTGLPHLYFLRALSYQYSGKWNDAVNDLEIALHFNPQEYSYRFHYASVLARLGRHDEAKAHLAEADKTPDPVVRSQCCLLHQTLGEHEIAESTLDKLVQENPNNATIYAARGAFRSMRAEHEAAMDDLLKAMAIRPSPEILIRQAMILRKQKDFDRAEELCNEALKLMPKYTPAIRGRAWINIERGDYKQAIDDCTTAINSAIPDADSFTVRATAYHKLGRHADARADFQMAEARMAERGLFHYHRGLFLAETGEKEAAMNDLKAASRIFATQDSRWYLEKVRTAISELS